MSDQLRLDPFEIVAKDVVQNYVVERRDQLHDRVGGVLVDKAGHRRVFQILQLVAEMNRVHDLPVGDVDSLLELHFIREEFPEVGLLGQ